MLAQSRAESKRNPKTWAPRNNLTRIQMDYRCCWWPCEAIP